MSTLTLEAKALKIWSDEDNLWVLLQDGRQLSIPLTYFPRLLNFSIIRYLWKNLLIFYSSCQ